MLITSYAFTGEWAKAQVLLTELIENLMHITSVKSYNRILGQIANFYNQSGQHEQAEQFASELFTRDPAPRLMCLTRAVFN